MFFLGHSLIIINWMKFLTTIKRFILHKNPIHNIRDRGFQRLEQKNQGERFKFCVNRKTDIRYVISYRGQNLFFRVLSLFVL